MWVCVFVCVVSAGPLFDPVSKEASAPVPVEGLFTTSEVLVLLLEPELASEMYGEVKILMILQKNLV